MTKLTTERLEKFVNDIKTDGMCDITDYQVALALRQLLAYEQATKNPVAWGLFDASNGALYNYASSQRAAEQYRDHVHQSDDSLTVAIKPLYTEPQPAPVLPKQPELVENLKKVMNSWLAMEPKLAYQPEFTDVMMLLDAEAAPAQPVILEQAKREQVRREHAEWSDATFGDVGPAGPLKHLSKEAPSQCKTQRETRAKHDQR